MKTKNLCSPFLVFDGNDLMIFENTETLQAKLEPIDIEDNAYQIFDSQGYLLNFTVRNINQEVIFCRINFCRTKQVIEFKNIIRKDLDTLTFLLNNYYKTLFNKPIECKKNNIVKIIEHIVYFQGYSK